MGVKMRKRVLGLVSFCVGAGMLLAVLVPAFGWALAAALALISIGYHMSRHC